MIPDPNRITARFERALFQTTRNLGPRLIKHARLDLTPAQLLMLYLIGRDAQLTISKLAEKMDVNPSAISVMLDRLEGRGYVVRVRDQSDRRVVHVTVSESGWRALNDVIELRRQRIQSILDQLHADELEAFMSAFEKLAHLSDAIHTHRF